MRRKQINRYDNELLKNSNANFGLTNSERTSWRTHNMGLKEMAGDVIKQTVVLLSRHLFKPRNVMRHYRHADNSPSRHIKMKEK